MKTVDSSGVVVNEYEYDVYGTLTASSGNQDNEFQFAGQQTDPTGLQYLRARYYDMENGVFLSRDPLSDTPRWGQSAFSYATGNPILYFDPLGLCSWKKWGDCRPRDVVDVTLDVLATGAYGTYYVSYQAFRGLDSVTQLCGPLERVCDAGAINPAANILMELQILGLGGDIAIDILKDVNGTGQGWADEGHVGSICPDFFDDIVDDVFGKRCPRTYFPGVHPTTSINEKGVVVTDTGKPSSVDIQWWGF